MDLLFLFLAFIFAVVFLIGRMLEKIRVPWIFSALLVGAALAFYNPFELVTSSQSFSILAQLGMYFLLFVIGFEIDLTKMKKLGKFILKSTVAVIFLEAFFGTLVVHFIFGYAWFISFIVAISFATVGEAILIPILDEFKIINTKLGQSIIGIGTLDDILEIIILIVVIIIAGSTIQEPVSIGLTIGSLFILFGLAYGLTRFSKTGKKFKFTNIEMLFLFVLFIFFLFLGVGELAQGGAIAALLAGIALKTFIPNKRLKTIESEVKTICYGFFAPLFFVWVGMSININYIIAYPLLIVLVVLVSAFAKLIGGYIFGKKELGKKQAILLGIGLSARFSTSIIIVKILLDNNIIGIELYSVIIASSIIFTFLIPFLFSHLLVNWKEEVY